MSLSQSWAELDAKNQKNSSYANTPKRPRPDELVDIYDKKLFTNTYKTIRLFGPIKADAMHTIRGKRKLRDGSIKEVVFSVPCLNFDRQTGERVENDCPFCKYVNAAAIRYYQNAIIREFEEEPPTERPEWTDSEKELKSIDGFKAHVKEKDSKSWTPVRMVQITSSMARSLTSIEGLNRYKDEETGEKRTASPSDLKYGVDLLIKYIPNNEPARKYELQRDPDSGKTPISNEMRRNYLVYDLEIPEVDAEEIKKSAADSIKIATPDEKHKNAWQEFMKELEAKDAEKAEKKAKSKEIKQVSLDDDDMEDMSPAQEAMSESEDVSFTSKSNKSNTSDLDEEFEDL